MLSFHLEKTNDTRAIAVSNLCKIANIRAILHKQKKQASSDAFRRRRKQAISAAFFVVTPPGLRRKHLSVVDCLAQSFALARLLLFQKIQAFFGILYAGFEPRRNCAMRYFLLVTPPGLRRKHLSVADCLAQSFALARLLLFQKIQAFFGILYAGFEPRRNCAMRYFFVVTPPGLEPRTKP